MSRQARHYLEHGTSISGIPYRLSPYTDDELAGLSADDLTNGGRLFCEAQLGTIIKNAELSLEQYPESDATRSQLGEFIADFRDVAGGVLKLLDCVEDRELRTSLFLGLGNTAALAGFLGKLARTGALATMEKRARGARMRDGRTRNAAAEADKMRARILAELRDHPSLDDGKIFNRLRDIASGEAELRVDVTEKDRKRVKKHIAAIRAETLARRSA